MKASLFEKISYDWRIGNEVSFSFSLDQIANFGVYGHLHKHQITRIAEFCLKCDYIISKTDQCEEKSRQI